jgi:hypothetical protein
MTTTTMMTTTLPMPPQLPVWIPDPAQPAFRISQTCWKTRPCRHIVERPPHERALLAGDDICRMLRVTQGRCTIPHFEVYDDT